MANVCKKSVNTYVQHIFENLIYEPYVTSPTIMTKVIVIVIRIKISGTFILEPVSEIMADMIY